MVILMILHDHHIEFLKTPLRGHHRILEISKKRLWNGPLKKILHQTAGLFMAPSNEGGTVFL
jgi:hypothetical protein